MTQTRFAVEAVKVAISTIARWETSDPPHGETLLKLAAIAREKATALSKSDAGPFWRLEGLFQSLYADEFLSNIKHSVGLDDTTPTLYLWIQKNASGRPAVYCFSKMEGSRKVKAEARRLIKEGSKKLAEFGQHILELNEGEHDEN